MFYHLNEYKDDTKYDGLREFCLREKTDEEYLRRSAKKISVFRRKDPASKKSTEDERSIKTESLPAR